MPEGVGRPRAVHTHADAAGTGSGRRSPLPRSAPDSRGALSLELWSSITYTGIIRGSTFHGGVSPALHNKEIFSARLATREALALLSPVRRKGRGKGRAPVWRQNLKNTGKGRRRAVPWVRTRCYRSHRAMWRQFPEALLGGGGWADTRSPAAGPRASTASGLGRRGGQRHISRHRATIWHGATLLSTGVLAGWRAGAAGGGWQGRCVNAFSGRGQGEGGKGGGAWECAYAPTRRQQPRAPHTNIITDGSRRGAT